MPVRKGHSDTSVRQRISFQRKLSLSFSGKEAPLASQHAVIRCCHHHQTIKVLQKSTRCGIPFTVQAASDKGENARKICTVQLQRRLTKSSGLDICVLDEQSAACQSHAPDAVILFTSLWQ